MDLPDAGLHVITSLALSTPACSRQSLVHITRKTSWENPVPPPSSPKATTTNAPQEDLDDDIELQSSDGFFSSCETLENIAALGLSFHGDEAQVPEAVKLERFSLEDLEMPAGGDRPFNKWMRSLQRRATNRRKTVSCDVTGSALEHELFETPSTRRRTAHKKSSSGSSYGFVTAVKSASISLASFSVAPRSKMTAASSRHQRADRSSKASNIGRTSEDSSYLASGAVIDQAVTNRLLQRRRVIEEIIATEESYLADVKFLMNARPPSTIVLAFVDSLTRCT